MRRLGKSYFISSQAIMAHHVPQYAAHLCPKGVVLEVRSTSICAGGGIANVTIIVVL